MDTHTEGQTNNKLLLSAPCPVCDQPGCCYDDSVPLLASPSRIWRSCLVSLFLNRRYVRFAFASTRPLARRRSAVPSPRWLDTVCEDRDTDSLQLPRAQIEGGASRPGRRGMGSFFAPASVSICLFGGVSPCREIILWIFQVHWLGNAIMAGLLPWHQQQRQWWQRFRVWHLNN